MAAVCSVLISIPPKYDSGVFFSNGQDPLKKDVVEMLFRIFDGRNLVLIPALQLSVDYMN